MRALRGARGRCARCAGSRAGPARARIESPRAPSIFHDELSALALVRGWLRLFTLRLDDVAVAAVYRVPLSRHGAPSIQSGFDPRLARAPASAAHRPVGLSIKAAVEAGREYGFLHGDEAYKFHWARRTRGDRTARALSAARARAALPPRDRGESRRRRTAARRVLPDAVAQRLAVGLGIGG